MYIDRIIQNWFTFSFISSNNIMMSSRRICTYYCKYSIMFILFLLQAHLVITTSTSSFSSSVANSYYKPTPSTALNINNSQLVVQSQVSIMRICRGGANDDSTSVDVSDIDDDDGDEQLDLDSSLDDYVEKLISGIEIDSSDQELDDDDNDNQNQNDEKQQQQNQETIEKIETSRNIQKPTQQHGIKVPRKSSKTHSSKNALAKSSKQTARRPSSSSSSLKKKKKKQQLQQQDIQTHPSSVNATTTIPSNIIIHDSDNQSMSTNTSSIIQSATSSTNDVPIQTSPQHLKTTSSVSQMPPPPNSIHRFLLNQGRIGHIILSLLLLLSEFLQKYIPELFYMFQNISSFLGISSHSSRHHSSSLPSSPLSSQPTTTMHSTYAAFAGSTTTSSVGGKKLSSQQKKQLDQVSLNKLHHIDGGVKEGKYKHLSNVFMKRYNLGKYAQEEKMFQSFIAPLLGDDKDDDGGDTLNLSLQGENVQKGITIDDLDSHNHDNDDQSSDNDDDDDDDWVVKALSEHISVDSLKRKNRNQHHYDNNYEEDDDFSNVYNIHGDDKNNDATARLLQVAGSSKLSSLEQQQHQYRSRRRRSSTLPKASDRDGGGGVLGRIRAVGTNNAMSSYILGAYPNDAVSIEKAGDKRGVIELAQKYGYGDWSDSDDDYVDDGSNVLMTNKRRKKKKSSSSSSLLQKRYKSASTFHIEKHQDDDPFTFTFDIGVRSKSSSSSPSSKTKTKHRKRRTTNSSLSMTLQTDNNNDTTTTNKIVSSYRPKRDLDVRIHTPLERTRTHLHTRTHSNSFDSKRNRNGNDNNNDDDRKVNHWGMTTNSASSSSISSSSSSRNPSSFGMDVVPPMKRMEDLRRNRASAKSDKDDE